MIAGVDEGRYRLIPVGIERRSGRWFWYGGDRERIAGDEWQSGADCVPVFPSMDREIHGLCYLEGGKMKTISLDAALPILHGKNGEDGTLQGTLELMGVPVIGCGLLSSALCMDKVLAHRIVAADGIKTAESFTLQKGYSEAWLYDTALRLGYPLFVKPLRSGSSLGISRVCRSRNLLAAVKNAFLHDTTVVVEKAVEGFEVGCAVLGTEDLLVGAVDEIELSQGFFDYTEKYTLKTSGIHVPARISEKKAEEIRDTACRIYRLLGCSGFARVDMFLTPAGEVYFNEVNTIPGFTAHSRYPNMLKEVGFSFKEIIERLLGAGAMQMPEDGR